MSRAVGDDDIFSRSFMYLGFIAAALIVIVQWRDFSTRSATATVADNSAVITTAERYQPRHRTSSTTLQGGLATTLEGVIESTLALGGTKLVIDLSDRQVYFYNDGTLAANYEIAVGRSGWETPTGEFKVINMHIDPAWQHPFTGEIVQAGVNNPLGSRWIGFWTNGTHQIGLHGTNQEDLIGQAVSHGCIRMREADVQALYQLVSLDMLVVVRP